MNELLENRWFHGLMGAFALGLGSWIAARDGNQFFVILLLSVGAFFLIRTVAPLFSKKGKSRKRRR